MIYQFKLRHIMTIAMYKSVDDMQIFTMRSNENELSKIHIDINTILSILIGIILFFTYRKLIAREGIEWEIY